LSPVLSKFKLKEWIDILPLPYSGVKGFSSKAGSKYSSGVNFKFKSK